MEKLTMRLGYSSEHGVREEGKGWARCASLLVGVIKLHLQAAGQANPLGSVS